MSAGKHTPERVTDKEAARELFVAGYLQALDDVGRGLPSLHLGHYLANLRSKAAAVQTSAAIAKATGAAQ